MIYNSRTFQEAVQQRIDEHTESILRRLEDDIFNDGACATPHDLPPLTWRARAVIRLARVRAYVVTLWRALRGDDPYENEEW